MEEETKAYEWDETMGYTFGGVGQNDFHVENAYYVDDTWIMADEIVKVGEKYPNLIIGLLCHQFINFVFNTLTELAELRNEIKALHKLIDSHSHTGPPRVKY